MSCESSLADLTMDMFEDDCREQFLTHINELQEAVVGMKSAFTTAQLQLESIHGEDKILRDELHQTKNQSAEILRLILSLKSEVSSLKEVVQTTQLMQHGLQSTVQSLILERDILLDELAKNGAITESLRGRFCSRVSGFGRPSSGSESTNDSGVALLLERAHAAFNGVPNSHFGLNSVGLLFRDQDSLPGDQTHAISHHVHEYLNGLTPIHHNTDPSGFSSFNTDTGPPASYDSDSSLTLAAAKSLSLSNSLSKQCGLELDQEDEKNRTRLIHGHEESDSDSQLPQVNGVCIPKKEKTMGVAEYFNPSDGDISIQSNSRNKEFEEQVNFKETQRLKVAKELIETERKYCHTLRTIQETFAQPLKKSGILTMKDINILFPDSVFDLYDKHCGLLAKLEERISSWNSDSTVGDLLDEFTNVGGSEVLNLYTSYVNDFDSCLNTFHKLCRSSGDFTRFLKCCLDHPTCSGLDLGAFLLTPVQRMPRYILLLKQMIKFTEPNHPDFKNINKCLERLRDYLKRLNDSMEHSFQLVTAQMTPPKKEQEATSGSGFSNKNNFQRASVSSRSSASTGEEIIHKIRYKRSTSVPRNQKESADVTKTKLKSRSKSDWAVCKSNNVNQNQHQGCCRTCNCNGQRQHSNQPSLENGNKNGRYNNSSLKKHLNSGLPLDRAVSDSDINSDVEDVSTENSAARKISTSKSLHDFKRDSGSVNWNISEPSLCDNDEVKLLRQQNIVSSGNRDGTMLKGNLVIRPIASGSGSGGRYVARIVAERGSEPELNKSGKSPDKNKKKRTSIRASLKNMFSLKKRYSSISNSDTARGESNYYRVLYAENKTNGENHYSSNLSMTATTTVASTASKDTKPNISISPLIKYLHRFPAYLDLVVFSVRETTV